MCCRQLRILRHNNHTLGIDDRSRKYHSIFKIIHGYCTQDKPSLDYVLYNARNYCTYR